MDHGPRSVEGLLKSWSLATIDVSTRLSSGAFMQAWPLMWRWRLAVLLAGLTLAGCGSQAAPGKPTIARPAPAVQPGAADAQGKPAAPVVGEPGPFRFVDIQPGSGVNFTHVSGMTAEKLFPTANGSG